MPELQLRSYQAIAYNKIWNSWNTERNIILRLNVAGGKSEIAAFLLQVAASHGKSSMFVVHGRELVFQFSRRLDKYNIPHGIMMAGETPSSHPIQVVSIDTLRSRYGEKDFPQADYVVIDEVHEFGRYEMLWEAMPNARKLGLSATPCLAGMKGLGDYFDKMVHGPSPMWLVNNGYLIAPEIYIPELPDMSHLKVGAKTQEYNPRDLDNIMATDEIVANSFEWWKRITGGEKRTVAFCAGVQNSIMMRDRFLLEGIPSAHIDGTTPKEEREEIFQALREGDILVIFNNRVLDRGFDEPSLEVMLDLQPNNDIRTYIQKSGRVMRTHPGKLRAIIIDGAGNFHRHGDPIANIEWPLHNDENVNIKERMQEEFEEQIKKDSIKVNCDSCGFLFDSKLGKCPKCGHPITRERAQFKLKEVGLKLGLYDRKNSEVKKLKPTMQEKTSWYRSLLAYAQERGYDRAKEGHGWASHKYKEKFGVWPNKFTENGDSIPKKQMKPSDRILPEVNEFVSATNREYAQRMKEGNSE